MTGLSPRPGSPRTHRARVWIAASSHRRRAELAAASHALARRALQEWFAEDPGRFDIGHDRNGRPLVVARHALRVPDISISRTEGYAAVALGQSSAVGVDIEHLHHPLDRLDHVLDTFGAHERQAVDDCADRAEAIIGLWTMKEALGKALGKGLAYDEQFYRIRPTADFFETLGNGETAFLTVRGWAIGLMKPRPDLCLALATAASLSNAISEGVFG